MNGAALNKADLAAWRSLLTRPDATRLLAAAVYYLASALVIPFVTNESLALLFVAACAVFFYMQTRTLISLLAPAIPALLLFGVSGSMMLPAAFFAIVFGGACGAMLLLAAKSPVRDAVLVLLPLGAYLAAYLLRGDPINALLTLLPLPVALVATFAVRRCAPFAGAVAALTAAVAAGLLLAGGVTLALMDLLDVSLLPDFIGALGDALIAALEEGRAMYADMGVTIEISEVTIRNMLSELVNLSPAIFTVIAMVTAYFTWRTLMVLLVSFGVLPRLPRLMLTPAVSATAAILFLISYFVALIANAEAATPTGAVGQNLALILEPGLALVGLGQLLRRDAPRSCLSVLLLMALVYLVWVSPATALAAAAFLGAIHTLIAAYHHTKSSKGEQ